MPASCIPRRRLIAGALLLAACGPPAAPPALPLEPDDFTLYGVPADSDSAEIRLSFGEPDSIAVMENPFENVPMVTWIYPEFEARFGAGGVPLAYVIRGGSEATARGARVGDTVRRVQQLYGRPASRVDDSWTYVHTDPGSDMRVIDFVLRNDSVARIYIGRAER